MNELLELKEVRNSTSSQAANAFMLGVYVSNLIISYLAVTLLVVIGMAVAASLGGP